jgi:hypothetical protein
VHKDQKYHPSRLIIGGLRDELKRMVEERRLERRAILRGRGTIGILRGSVNLSLVLTFGVVVV